MLYGADTGTIAKGNDTRTRTNNMRTLMWICGCVEKQRNIISETKRVHMHAQDKVQRHD